MKRSWMWCLRHPKLSGPLAAFVVLIAIIGAVSGAKPAKPLPGAGSPSLRAPGAAIGPSTPTGSITTTSASAARSVSPPQISSAPADRPSSTSAVALLATLAVKGRAPNTGYSRAQFGPAWTDDNDDPDGHNGCDTRNDVLRRDLTAVTIKPDSNGCTVHAGTLHDPYTGATIAFTRGARTSPAVQIDHVVALDDAWQTGAQYWPAQRRVDLANDPLELLAVDGPANEAKGAGDAATWLPPNKAYRCAYVARQVAVKARYGLWVTPAERDAIARVLANCPGQRAPTETGTLPAVRAAA